MKYLEQYNNASNICQKRDKNIKKYKENFQKLASPGSRTLTI